MIKHFRALTVFSCCLLAATTFADEPKFLKKASKSLNEDSPEQVVIYRALESYPTFEAILGAPYSAEEKQAFIDDMVSSDTVAVDRMQMMQLAEALAPTLRHVDLPVDDMSVYYSEQSNVQARAVNESRGVNWIFEGTEQEAAETAQRWEDAIEALLSKDRKWMTQRNEADLPNGATQRAYLRQYPVSGGSMMSRNKAFAMITLVHTTNKDSDQGSVQLNIAESTIKVTP